MADVKPASPLKLVRTFFGLNLTEMKSEWTTLPQKDKDDIVQGLTPDANGVALRRLLIRRSIGRIPPGVRPFVSAGNPFHFIQRERR